MHQRSPKSFLDLFKFQEVSFQIFDNTTGRIKKQKSKKTRQFLGTFDLLGLGQKTQSSPGEKSSGRETIERRGMVDLNAAQQQSRTNTEVSQGPESQSHSKPGKECLSILQAFMPLSLPPCHTRDETDKHSAPLASCP